MSYLVGPSLKNYFAHLKTTIQPIFALKPSTSTGPQSRSIHVSEWDQALCCEGTDLCMHTYLALPNHFLPLISHFPNLIWIFFWRFPLRFAYKGAVHVYLPAQRGTVSSEPKHKNDWSPHTKCPLRITSWTFKTMLHVKYTSKYF